MTLKILATDLDGTLIPLDGNIQNRSDLRIIEQELADLNMQLAFVTGRHFASVHDAIQQFALPSPQWIFCDVGSSIYERVGSTTPHTKPANVDIKPSSELPQKAPTSFVNSEDYRQHLLEITSEYSTEDLASQLQSIASLQLQEPDKQSEFKLSYYTDRATLPQTLQRIQVILETKHIPYSVIGSEDPFNGDGLVDFLPRHVSKAYALNWWSTTQNLPKESILFAGDSGNDLAALTAGFKTIVVANAKMELVDQVRASHAASKWENRLHLAASEATSGVLNGLRHFSGICRD